MPSYAAFIGHQPHLSLAELAATVPGFVLTSCIERSVVIFESKMELGPGFLDMLGGTVVLAQQIEGKFDLDGIPDLLAEQTREVPTKVTFSLRAAGTDRNKVRDLFRLCKKRLKKAGKSSRYVGNERDAAPSIVLRTQGLLNGKEGCELCMVQVDEKTLWVGRSVAAQDVNGYTKRDMEKPVRDTTTGLLPPKLAQILLNFGVWLVSAKAAPAPETKKGAKAPATIVYDPFCGTGVIPMESMLRGFSVLASDKSEPAVKGCSKNIEWVRKHYNITKQKLPASVWKQDATKPFETAQMKETGIPTLIVTETTLGPNLRARPTVKDAQKFRSEVEKLEIAFLQNAAETAPGAPIVCTFPVWFTSKGPVFLDRIWEALDKAGYQAVLPPSVEMLQGRMSLLYRRPEQFVGREIVLLRPKKRK